MDGMMSASRFRWLVLAGWKVTGVSALWARLVAPPRPFHTVPYAYAVKPGDDDWLREIDRFVAAVKRDGRLEAAARRHGLSEIVLLK